MGLFDKKECAICGKKIGMLGTRKVEDGVICSDCNKKLSPFFSERKRSTVQDIKQQLDYREQNRQNLASFNPTRVLGENTKVYIDDNQRKFVVSRQRDFKAENADIIDFSQVSNVRYELDEDRNELYTTDSNGNSVSYNPPRYEYLYEITVFISVNSPYFSEIKFDVTNTAVDRYTQEFRRAEQMAMDIVNAFGGNAAPAMNGGNMPYNQTPYQQPMQQNYQQPIQQNYQQPVQQGYQQPVQQGYQQPVQQGYQQPAQQGYQQPVQQAPVAWFCPNCGAQNSGGFCPNCGTPKP